MFQVVTYVLLHNVIKPLFHDLSVWTCSPCFHIFWNGEILVLSLFPKLSNLPFIYLSILSFNSCLIEIQFLFSYNILENFLLFVWFFLCRVETSHLCHIRGSTLSLLYSHGVSAWMPCHLFSSYFCLLGSSVWTFFIPPLNLFPNSLSSHSSWRWRRRPLSSFYIFVT